MSAPQLPHWEVVLRIVEYLKAHPRRGLFYQANGHLRVEAFTGSDWVGLFDRSSTTRYCTFLGGNLVTWKSKKQIVVAWSSAETKYRAMARRPHTTCSTIWIRSFLEEMEFVVQFCL